MVIFMKYIFVFFAFCAGWYVCSVRYESQWQEHLNSLLQEHNVALQQTREKEHEQRERADNASKNLQKALADIDSMYEHLKSERLHKPSSTSNMSRTATNSSRTTSKSSCKCTRNDSQKFQRLYEQQLVVAKQCDDIAVKYNELINLSK